MPTPRKIPPMLDPALMAQWRPTQVPLPLPPIPPGGMPGGPGKPPSTNISLRLGSGDIAGVPPQAKSAIVLSMLKKMLSPAMQEGGAGRPPLQSPPAPPMSIPQPPVSA